MGINAKMLVRTKRAVSEQNVLQWAYELSSTFGPQKFDIVRPNNIFGSKPHHCLEIITRFTQDGPTLIPESGETFIEVHLRSRYYGKGYPRGNLPLIMAIADWLERKILGAQVWYGGDYRVEVAPFDKSARDDLWDYLCEVGCKPYEEQHEIGPVCNLCQVPMRWLDSLHCYCYGCEYEIESYDGGETFTERAKNVA